MINICIFVNNNLSSTTNRPHVFFLLTSETLMIRINDWLSPTHPLWGIEPATLTRIEPLPPGS